MSNADTTSKHGYEVDWHTNDGPFDPALFAELGPRATGQLKGENHGPARKRRGCISSHARGAERRAKHARVAVGGQYQEEASEK